MAAIAFDNTIKRVFQHHYKFCWKARTLDLNRALSSWYFDQKEKVFLMSFKNRGNLRTACHLRNSKSCNRSLKNWISNRWENYEEDLKSSDCDWNSSNLMQMLFQNTLSSRVQIISSFKEISCWEIFKSHRKGWLLNLDQTFSSFRDQRASKLINRCEFCSTWLNLFSF